MLGRACEDRHERVERSERANVVSGRAQRARWGMTDVLLVERSGGVATVTLNRPDSMNSLSLDLKEALVETTRDLAADDSVRAVVLTGAGRAFCVGQDLREHVASLRSG